MTLLDYNTAVILDGVPSDELVAASRAAGETGAVSAWLDGETWQHVPDCEASRYSAFGRAVTTVYVELDD